MALLDENLPVAYGIVRDLSEIGACIMTDTILEPGSSYQFRMSFFGGAVLETAATVIWHESSNPAGRRAPEVPHGLEFHDMNEAHRDNLKRILDSREFGAGGES